MGGKAYGHSDSQAGGASVQNFSDSSGKPGMDSLRTYWNRGMARQAIMLSSSIFLEDTSRRAVGQGMASNSGQGYWIIIGPTPEEKRLKLYEDGVLHGITEA
jgi:hypothetical protein